MFTKTIYNVETGEIIERNMTDEESAQRKADEAKAVEEAKAKAQAEAAKAALLDRLGITEDEAKLLLA
jgi:hypothetical protein